MDELDCNHGSAMQSGAALSARLRPISGFEEELIAAGASESSTAALCNELLARCLVPSGVDPGAVRAAVARLLVPERDLALVALRRKSFGDRVESEVTCPACAAVNEVSFLLSDLPLDVVMPGPSITVDHDGQVVVVRLPTAADQERLMATATQNPAQRRTELLACLIDRIDQRTCPLSGDDVRALDSSLRLAIERAIEVALPDIDFAMDVRCSSCDGEFAAPFELQAFFLPS